MFKWDEGVKGKGDGEKTPVEPKAVQHAQPPTQRASGWQIGTGTKLGETVSTVVDKNRESCWNYGQQAIPYMVGQ